MRALTDKDLERAAGEAIGLELEGGEEAWFLWERKTAEPWCPLVSDQHAMRLVRHLHLHIDQRPGKQISVQDPHFALLVYGDLKLGEAALNRAIVECAAQIHARATGKT